MTRPAARTVLVLAVVGAVLAALTGCISNDPANAVGWLKSQSGIVSAQVVESSSEELLVSGTTRGELKPGLSDAQIGTLVKAVQAYTEKHHNVTIELGHGELAFVVGDDADTTQAIKLWHQTEKIPKLISAVSDSNAVSAGVLRADVGPVLESLLGLGVDLHLDAYADQAAANSVSAAAGSLSYVAASDCSPQRAVVAYTVAVASRKDVGSGQLELCDSLSMTLVPGTSLAAVAPGFRTELDAAGLTQFPVNLNNQPDDPADAHSADITPGDPAFFAVLPGLEATGVPSMAYLLTSDGTLTLTDYGDPASSLLAAVSAAPGAGALPAIVIKGLDLTVGGTLPQLSGLIAEATALGKVSPTIVGVVLTPTTGSVELNSPAGQDPDVATAAAALKASGATANRDFVVTYGAYEVKIANGVATIGDPNYTGGEFMNDFVTDWNG